MAAREVAADGFLPFMGAVLWTLIVAGCVVELTATVGAARAFAAGAGSIAAGCALAWFATRYAQASIARSEATDNDA